MKNDTVLALLLISSFLLFSACDDINQITPSDTITRESKSITDFNSLALSGAFEAFIQFSNTEEKVEIEANENVHEFIEVTKNGQQLSIGLQGNNSFDGTITLKAYITTNELVNYDLSGASKVTLLDNSSANNTAIELSGASNFTGGITAEQLDLDLSGASKVDLVGTADKTTLDLSGASEFKDYSFTTEVLNADLSGASTVNITVNDELNIKASGASTLLYKGDAIIINSELSGVSTVQRVD